MFRRLPPQGGDQRAVAEILNGVMDGKTNNTGTVTLATGGATTTTITDARIGASSVILLSPIADNSAISYYISSVSNGSAVITHTANITSGKTYKYVVVG
jgi:fibronectin type 3 domain-containing protein